MRVSESPAGVQRDERARARGTRIAVVFERRRSGAEALAQAAALAAISGTELTVVALAPQVSGPRCGAANDYVQQRGPRRGGG
jgi:hypothetical protein